MTEFLSEPRGEWFWDYPTEAELDRQFARIPPPLELPTEEPPITYVPTPTMGGKEEE